MLICGCLFACTLCVYCCTGITLLYLITFFYYNFYFDCPYLQRWKRFLAPAAIRISLFVIRLLVIFECIAFYLKPLMDSLTDYIDDNNIYVFISVQGFLLDMFLFLGSFRNGPK